MHPPDKILISRMDCLTAVGITAAERAIKQRLSVDLEFPCDAAAASRSDSIQAAVDYDRVAQTVQSVCASREFNLIETVAEEIAASVLGSFPISQVRVRVRKISPVPSPRVEFVYVEIVRPVSS